MAKADGHYDVIVIGSGFGGSVAAMNHGPIVLVPSAGTLPVTVTSYLATAKASATAAWLFGGTSSVSADVFNQAASLLTAP